MTRALIALLFAASLQATNVTLTWTGPTGTYDVYRASGACSPSTVFTKIGPGATAPYVDSNVPAGIYCYGITVTVNGVVSALSGTAVASATIPPNQPVLTITIASAGGAAVVGSLVNGRCSAPTVAWALAGTPKVYTPNMGMAYGQLVDLGGTWSGGMYPVGTMSAPNCTL